MTRVLRLASIALLCAAPAFAETLNCRSLNGNVTCSGSGGASCQRVDGRTVCLSGDGSVLQQFGAEAPRGSAEAGRQLRIERRGLAGPLLLEREGGRLRLRTDRLDLDLDD
jgi:hypothetical protein